MEYNQQELEARLAAMTPSAPDAALMDCLELAATGDPLHSTPIEAALEQRMRAFRPAPVSDRIAAAFLAAVGDMEFPVDTNLIPFPVKAASGAGESRYSRKRMFAAAAAVALLGGLSALLIPVHDKPVAVAKNANPPAARTVSPPPAAQIPQEVRQGVVPANFGHGVADVREHGRVWDQSGRPCRVVRVVYMDQVTTDNGERVEQPRVEYLLVPEKMD
jgi:hypothetical protein